MLSLQVRASFQNAPRSVIGDSNLDTLSIERRRCHTCGERGHLCKVKKSESKGVVTKQESDGKTPGTRQVISGQEGSAKPNTSQGSSDPTKQTDPRTYLYSSSEDETETCQVTTLMDLAEDGVLSLLYRPQQGDEELTAETVREQDKGSHFRRAEVKIQGFLDN